MKYGLFLPLFEEFADPTRVVALARRAEESGWDGLFVWDHVYGGTGVAVGDALVCISAVAVSTKKIRFGPLVTPLADRRAPWLVARQTTAVDHLSGGRLIFGAGPGDEGWNRELTAFPGAAQEDEERERRLDMLDESLDVLMQFWSGAPVRHDGAFMHVDAAEFLPVPVQRPRIPVWISARWPRRLPLRRAARFDGVVPIFIEQGDLTIPPDERDVQAIRQEVVRLGAHEGHDLVLRGHLGPKWTDLALDSLAALEAVGATWWLESFAPDESGSSVFERVAAGPPPPQ